MIKCEKIPKIRSSFISFCAFIAVIVSWHSLSSLYSAHNLIYPEEAGSSVWSDYKVLPVSSRIFCTWTAKAFWSVVDRMGTINPIVTVPRTPPINKEQSGGQRTWYKFIRSGLRNNPTGFDCVAWHHSGCEFQPLIASHIWLPLPFCLENVDFFWLWRFAPTNARQCTLLFCMFYYLVKIYCTWSHVQL